MEVWLKVEAAVGTSVDLAIEYEPDHTVREMGDALAARLGLATPSTLGVFCYRLGAVLNPNTRIADIALQHGDRLCVGSPTNSGALPQSGTGQSLCVLSVVGGPCNGARFALASGSHLVGRGERCSVPLDDDAMSREHLVLEIGRDANGVTIDVRDAGSSNGTFISGKRVEQPVRIRPGVMVEAGHSLLVVGAHSGRSAVRATPNGVVPFNRPPRMRPKTSERIFKIAAPPDPPEPRKLSVAAMVGPLLLGLPMLMIGLMSEGKGLVAMGAASIVGSLAMAVFSWFEDRRSGQGAFGTKKLAFYGDLETLAGRLRAANTEEAEERRRLAPNAAELLDRVRGIGPQLWERRADDADFLRVAIGWADQPSLSTVEFADGGDAGLRREAEKAIESVRMIPNVQITIDVARFGVAGLCGDPEGVPALARWVVYQLAALHSPRELVFAAALAADESPDWSWLMWLPHLRSDASPIEGSHLAVGEQAASSLFEAINALIRARRDLRGSQLNDSKRPLPAVVVLLSERLQVPRSAVTRMLEEGTGVGVYVLWMGGTAEALPGECGVIARVSMGPPTVHVTMPNLGTSIPAGALDQMSVDAALEMALLLAPIRDVTAGSARGQVPRIVNLSELLALDPPTPDSVRETWRTQPFGVRAPIGVSAGGTFELDIRHDGPHALVGGTTGAGKSELLQTIVASLAASHPPNRLTFLLVDYKGGAAFKDTVSLPHTVGFVTDLDGHLVHRALVSLNAELRYREHLLRQYGAKDLLEMERRHPDIAPPSLLLVVDEFASLAKELPEFVDGVVNVAQRGRALGIHMILATQRPAGSINDNIRANTNLRIALRFNDEADSIDVIGQRDAAVLPRTLKGRAFARLGQSDLTEFQVAYVGGHSLAGGVAQGEAIRAFPIQFGEVVRPRAAQGGQADLGPTDLQVMVATITDAAKQAAIPPQRPPWLPALPALLPLSAVSGRLPDQAALGIADLPEEQAQRPRFWDLETDGNLLVFGASGMGKTTLLRSIALDIAQHHSPTEFHMYGLDFATRGLQPLSALPHVGSVVNGEDIERVQRVIITIEREIMRRKDLFAAVGASTLAEYRRASGQVLPRVVLFLDSFGGFASTFEKVDFGEWIERLTRQVGEGRPLGIHWVITADRRSAVSLTLLTTISTRIILKMADDDEYSSLGIDGRLAKAASLPPGRCFMGSTVELQLALPGDDPSGDGQGAFVEREGQRLSALFPDARVQSIGSLPSSVPVGDLVLPPRLHAAVGIGQSELATVSIALHEGDLLVAGPNRSGRSTALATLARGIAATTPDAEMVALLPRRSPLADLGIWSQIAVGLTECEDLLAALVDRVAERTGNEAPVVVILDDGNELTDTTADGYLERVLRRGRDAAVHVIGAAESNGALRSYGGWIPQIRKDRRALLLNPDADIDGDLVGVRLPRRAGGGLPPGRGYLCVDGAIELVQVAS